jgi:hypothetical protein
MLPIVYFNKNSTFKKMTNTKFKLDKINAKNTI